MASSPDSSKQGEKKTSKLRQIIGVYKIVRSTDHNLDWQSALAFFAPIVLMVLLGVFLHWHWVTWILLMITGILGGLTLVMVVLARKAERLGYQQIEGKVGGSIAALQRLKRASYSFPEEPIWFDARRQEAIWCGTSYNGIYLIGEGDISRLREAMNKFENRSIKGITSGSTVPVFRVFVGEGEHQVSVRKLQKHIVHLKHQIPTDYKNRLLKKLHKKTRFTFTRGELNALNDRLRTIRQRSSMPIPHGIDPTKNHRMSRKALRGK